MYIYNIINIICLYQHNTYYVDTKVSTNVLIPWSYLNHTTQAKQSFNKTYSPQMTPPTIQYLSLAREDPDDVPENTGEAFRTFEKFLVVSMKPEKSRMMRVPHSFR